MTHVCVMALQKHPPRAPTPMRYKILSYIRDAWHDSRSGA